MKQTIRALRETIKGHRETIKGCYTTIEELRVENGRLRREHEDDRRELKEERERLEKAQVQARERLEKAQEQAHHEYSEAVNKLREDLVEQFKTQREKDREDFKAQQEMNRAVVEKNFKTFFHYHERDREALMAKLAGFRRQKQLRITSNTTGITTEVIEERKKAEAEREETNFEFNTGTPKSNRATVKRQWSKGVSRRFELEEFTSDANKVKVAILDKAPAVVTEELASKNMVGVM